MTIYNSTKQQSTGRAILTSINGVGNFLAWTGTDTQQNLNFNFQEETMTFSKGMISANGVRCSNYGPDLVVLPDGMTAYIIWADKNNVIKITKMSRKKVEEEKTKKEKVKDKYTAWSSVEGEDISVSGSNAASGPCAALGQQNGHLVLNVLWQDSSANAIAFTQLPIKFGTASSSSSPLEMESLDGDMKASSTPALVMDGGRSFLAYFDEHKQFNLAVDPLGGLAFGSPQKIEGVTSTFGPAFVPTAPGQAYLFWADHRRTAEGGMTTELRYQQIGTSAKSGGWALNPTKECGGTLSDSLVASAPSVQIVSIENPDTKALEKKFRVAWPKRAGTALDSVAEKTVVYTTDVSISHAAMPVVIATTI